MPHEERKLQQPPGVKLPRRDASSIQPPDGRYHLFGLTPEQYEALNRALRALGRERLEDQHLSCDADM